jgi:hypothetical protein
VRVTDSTGTAPIPGATVSLVRGRNTVLATGLTGADGIRVLSAVSDAGDADEWQVIVRRLGFHPADRFLVRPLEGWSDTLDLRVPLRAVPQTLGAVEVREQQSIRRRRLFIDADDIAAATLPITSALDVVSALRPVMIYGLGGTNPACNGIRYVWVNGRYIRNVPIREDVLARALMYRSSARPGSRLKRHGVQSIPLVAQSILASIRPEHIATMQASDCYDPPVVSPNSRAALFITLKAGVNFAEGIGSFVRGERDEPVRAGANEARNEARRAGAGASAPVVPGRPAAGDTVRVGAEPADALPTYRHRLLGVFDDSSGAPLADVAVVDVRTGARMTTSATGTATLVHLPDGGGTVRLERPGYVARELAVAISPADTVPITVVLVRAGGAPP